jgi:hypothetical protein|tara:strand:- start:58 stop:288 length:231 start_codon:yes stop_codon:yes gene_type:complete
MKKPNFSHEHKKIVPSELKVTASEVANEEAQADLDGDSEEQDLKDLISQPPIEQAEEWDDDSYKLDEDGEQFEISE